MACTIKSFSWIVLSLVINLFSKGSVLAQTLPFTNHTEFGILQNIRSLSSNSSFTFQTFNGVKANDWLNIGFTTGIDNYSEALIVPIALGTRIILPSERKFSLLGSLDMGAGAAFFEKDSRTNWTEGGFLFNPSIGTLMKTRDKLQFSLSIGYKRQVISKYEGRLGEGGDGLPNGYRSIYKERFIFNRASIRLGLFF